MLFHLQRAREENTRFEGETRSREIRYDTSAPVDSTTGKPPLWSETVTCTRGRYERVLEDDEARQTEWTGTQETLMQEHASQTLSVDLQTGEDKTVKEETLPSRPNPLLFLAGVIAGVAVTVLMKQVTGILGN